MNRYLFEYKVVTTNYFGAFSVVASSEDEARSLIKERVADLEFTEEKNIEIGKLLKIQDAKKTYFECEGCQ